MNKFTIIAIVVAITILIIAISLAIWLGGSKSETTLPPDAVTTQQPMNYREYTIYPDEDRTETTIMQMPFSSVDSSKKVCDALDDCAGFARYRGDVYYRSAVAAEPRKWGTASTYPDDASYMATPTPLFARATPRKYTFERGGDHTQGPDIAKARFKSAEESARVCDVLPNCAAFVRFKGDSYYRGALAPALTTWDPSFKTGADDGTYIPS